MSDTVFSESPNFMVLGLSSVNTTYELGSVFASTTRIGSSTHGSDCLLRIHCISEATADTVSGTKAKKHYNFKSKSETRIDKVVDQDFGRQKWFYESNTFGLDSYESITFGIKSSWYEHGQRNNVTKLFDSSRKKIAEPFTTETTNGLNRTTNGFARGKWKSKCTRGTRSIPIISD